MTEAWHGTPACWAEAPERHRRPVWRGPDRLIEGAKRVLGVDHARIRATRCRSSFQASRFTVEGAAHGKLTSTDATLAQRRGTCPAGSNCSRLSSTGLAPTCQGGAQHVWRVEHDFVTASVL